MLSFCCYVATAPKEHIEIFPINPPLKDLKWWSTTQTERNEKEADSVPRKPSNFWHNCVPRLFVLVFILFHNFLDDGYITLKYFSSWNSTLSCLIQKYPNGAIKGIVWMERNFNSSQLFTDNNYLFVYLFFARFPICERTFQTSFSCSIAQSSRSVLSISKIQYMFAESPSRSCIS